MEFSLCLLFAKLVSYTFLFWLPLYITKTGKHSDSQWTRSQLCLYAFSPVLTLCLAHLSFSSPWCQESRRPLYPVWCRRDCRYAGSLFSVCVHVRMCSCMNDRIATNSLWVMPFCLSVCLLACRRDSSRCDLGQTGEKGLHLCRHAAACCSHSKSSVVVVVVVKILVQLLQYFKIFI